MNLWEHKFPQIGESGITGSSFSWYGKDLLIFSSSRASTDVILIVVGVNVSVGLSDIVLTVENKYSSTFI